MHHPCGTTHMDILQIYKKTLLTNWWQFPQNVAC
jgi:hypothetical protein